MCAAIRKDECTVTSYTANQWQLTNTVAYKCNNQVTLSAKCTLKSTWPTTTIGAQMLVVNGAVAVNGSHMLMAVYGTKIFPAWIIGQSVFLKNDTEIPVNSDVYISGTYPCT